jgi:signal transduction histidine kinase
MPHALTPSMASRCGARYKRRTAKTGSSGTPPTYTPVMRPMGVSGGAGVRGRPRALPPPALTAAGWVAGLLTTALILGTPYLRFGYHSPSLHLVLDTVDACVALLVSYLVYGRFLRSRRLQDLLLAEGLFLLAVAGLGLTLFVGLFDDLRPGTVDVWLPLAIRVVGALLIGAAAVSGGRLVGGGWRRRAQALPWVVIAIAFVVLGALRERLPVGLGQSPPASAQHPEITGHWLLLTAQGATALCFLVASVSFTLQAGRRHDELVRWLGPACALAGFARVSYVLFPSLYSSWIYTGDFLRTGCYVVLLVGAAREIGQFWSAQSRAAVLEDRRRLARELHDGVVQELGYIRSEAHTLPGDASRRILAACDRALDESRAAVDALGRSSTEPLGFVLHRAARQVAERYDARVDVDLDDSVTADHEQRHALVRITREAVSNAIRHGNADRVFLKIVRDQEHRILVVSDDGRGFDLEAVSRTATGYGLTSMEERARALLGSYRIESSPGSGTTVAVTW